MLLDSASLYFRAFFGVPREITAEDGTPVNAVRGFLDMIAVLVEAHRPTRLVACWDDDWRPAWRVELLPSYKTHRVVAGADPAPGGGAPAPEQVEDDLAVQVPVIEEFLAAFGIAKVGAPGCEADDVIGTLATRAEPGTAVDIVSGDRDLFQLVDDARQIRVLSVAGRSGLRNRVYVDQAALQAKYGIDSGDGYATLAVLRGDTSDGIPGVAGIGEKTASALVSAFGSLPEILAAAGDPASPMSPAVRRKLLAATDYLAVAPTVVRVLRDADLPDVDDRVPPAPADPAAVDELARRWNVASSVDRVTAALAGLG